MAELSIHRSQCCGFRILRNINGKSPETIIRFTLGKMYQKIGFPYNAAFIMFGDETNNKTSGNKLVKYILDNNLGTITTYANSNVWIWEIKRNNCISHAKKLNILL